MKRRILTIWIAFVINCNAAISMADELLMARSTMSFSETMLMLQDTIRGHGYKLSRVQRVDIGLTQTGYDTDKYRVVFFGRPDEIRTLSEKYPELIPYLPIKVAIFAEGEETLVVTANPKRFSEFYPAPELTQVFGRWEKDLQSMFDDLRAAE